MLFRTGHHSLRYEPTLSPLPSRYPPQPRPAWRRAQRRPMRVMIPNLDIGTGRLIAARRGDFAGCISNAAQRFQHQLESMGPLRFPCGSGMATSWPRAGPPESPSFDIIMSCGVLEHIGVEEKVAIAPYIGRSLGKHLSVSDVLTRMSITVCGFQLASSISHRVREIVT